jgi:hypothetical protein
MSKARTIRYARFSRSIGIEGSISKSRGTRSAFSEVGCTKPRRNKNSGSRREPFVPGHCRVARCTRCCDPIRTLRTTHPGTNASPAVGTGTRIGLAIGRTKPGRRRLVKAGREPIAEGGTRRRQIVLARHFVHLRHPRHFDLGRWRRRRWRWQIDLRTARQKYLRERRICGENRANHTGNDE